MAPYDPQRQGNSHDNPHPTASEAASSNEDHKARSTRPPSEHVSLKTWIRNAPWSQYFKDGCRLIIKSPFNFFVFFCCLSVVVWGAFLVLLLGNMVKLKDDPTQKLWIEIASQVLNGFFTLANVPVHPKRFIGFVRGVRVWREDKAIQQQFLSRFSSRDTIEPPIATGGSDEQKPEQELLKRLQFYRCFPGYGRERTEAGTTPRDQGSYTPPLFDTKADMRSGTMDKRETEVVVSRSRSGSKSQRRSVSVDRSRTTDGSIDPSASPLHPVIGMGGQDSTIPSGLPVPSTTTTLSSSSSPAPYSPTKRIRVDIAEEELNELLTEETHRVVHSVVLPFLPFPLDVTDDSSNETVTINGTTGHDTEESMSRLEEGHGSMPLKSRVIQRGASYTALPKSSSSRRISPRTRSRTLTMSMADDQPNSSESPRRPTFVIHENHGSSETQPTSATQAELDISSAQSPTDSSKKQKKAPPQPVPMPEALTQEQMDWVDEHDARLLKRKGRLQRAWPWYNYTIPSGIEPVDFFVHPEEQPPVSPTSPILLSSSPAALAASPARFCQIVGSFNLNSMIQEILCGFMWGMNYHVRPSWVVGTGMVFGCMAAIVPSVLIMLHEQAMSRMRVVATAEEAIQDALDEKRS